MGLYDRGYMKDPEGGRAFKTASPRGPVAPGEDLSWWQRFRFKLWLALHPRRREPEKGDKA